jgi:hypothetical protein
MATVTLVPAASGENGMKIINIHFQNTPFPAV